MKKRFLTMILAASLMVGQLAVPVTAYGAGETVPLATGETVGTQTNEETADNGDSAEEIDKTTEVLAEDASVVKEEENTEETTTDENLDYVLGRPMTEEEIQEQRDMFVEQPVMPDVGYEPGDADLPFQLWSSRTGEYYDARQSGLISPVKNQGAFGTCWAFSALSAAETTMMNTYVGLPVPDYSELQLAYFFYNRAGDALGNTDGDANKLLAGNYMSIGGNHYLTTWELASWTGAAEETALPYPTGNAPTSLDSTYAYDSNESILRNALFISKENQSAMKAAIQTYGSLAISYMSSSQYYNAETAAYCDKTDVGRYNHAVTIVGWDDSYSAENFSGSTPPDGDGAWIVKNSYGTTFGKEGYFYLSYEDTSISCPTVFDMQSADTYDHNYQYDGTSGMYSYGDSSSGINFSNVYEAKGNAEGKDESIRAVGFGMSSVNTNYSIQIYTNLADASDPTSGTAQLATPQTGQTSTAGYYTVELEEPITVGSGDTFAVVISLPNGGEMFVESKGSLKDWVSFEPKLAAGQSFWKGTSGEWQDSYADAPSASNRFCARIKAFTNDTDTVLPKLTMSETTKTLNVGDSASLSVKVTPNADLALEWTSDDTNVVTVDQGVITAVGAGTAKITAKYQSRMVHCVVTVNHTIQYHLNGGVNDSANPAGYTGTEVILQDPTKDGYIFEGWYTDDAYTNAITKLSAGVWQDYDLYALWGQWKTTEGIKRYYIGDTYLRNEAHAVAGEYYQFDDNGAIVHGWKKTAEGWYFYDIETGIRKYGWLYKGGKWYYLDSAKEGLMSVGFIKVRSQTFYMNMDGDMAIGWKKIDGKWYYFKSGGYMANGWLKLGNNWFYLDPSTGKMAVGWIKPGNTWYYMNSGGSMATGWKKVSGVWYYLKSSGAMAKGWIKLGSNWYYLKGSGAMATGWLTLSGKTYYLKSSGAMATGGLRINNAYYYFNRSGVLVR